MNPAEQFLNDWSTWILGGMLVLLLAWESMRPFFGFFRRNTKERVVHGLRNFTFQAVNAILIALIFTIAWAWAASMDFGLLKRIGWSVWLEALIAILVFDCWTYWWHRMNHRLPFLWRFHRVHHSDPEMDVTTANRFHFGEIILSSLLRIPLVLLLGAELWHLALYELIMMPIVQFHHANIAVGGKLDRALSFLIPTPVMHKIHHSRFQPETDSNYSSLLSVWDYLFRSFRYRRDPENISLGIDGCDDQRLLSLAAQPLKDPRHTG